MKEGRKMKRCYSCGNEGILRTIKNVLLKTRGNLVPVKKGYICDDCENKVILGKANEHNKRYAHQESHHKGRKMKTKKQTNKLCCSKGIREDCECYKEGKKIRTKEILKLIDEKVQQEKDIIDKMMMKGIKPSDKEVAYYIVTHRLEELKQEIKEEK